jgi:hypothetical protein
MLAGAQSASAAGARNWELWSGAAEQEELLGKVVDRMKDMGFSEQRMKVGGLNFIDTKRLLWLVSSSCKR